MLLGWWKRELRLERAPENEAPTAGGGGGGGRACLRVLPSVGWRTRAEWRPPALFETGSRGELDIWVGRRKVVY